MPDQDRSNPAFEATILSSSRPAAASSEPDALVGTRLRHFEVRELLGRGGMGAVYLGWDTSLDRPVALKVLDAAIGRDPELLTRFVREARAQARLRHANITQIYFIGEERGINFFAMEYVEGDPLDKALAEGQRFPWPDSLEYIIAAARGLREAFAKGFIHRDVKPSNLLLDKDKQIKIADFGLAKSLKGDPELTREGVIVGSPLYMAPEQGRAENVDHRADIYSLGCAFYHLLTGRPPFTAPTPVGVITRHVTDRATSIRSLNPEVPEPVERVVVRMMAKDPNARFDSYDQLIAALEAVRPGRQEHSGFFARAMALAIDLVCLGALAPLLRVWVFLLAAVYFVVAHGWRGQTLGKWLLKLRVTDEHGQRPSWKRVGLRFLVFAWAPLLWAVSATALVLLYQDSWESYRQTQMMPSPLFNALFVLALGVAFTGFGYLAGFLLAAFHPKKRALHDLVARTYVTYKLGR